MIASSGRSAIKVLEESPVSAALLEHKMEGMDADAIASVVCS
jgi:response regulator RpfG family c-di-GMP phosphodiesterase